MFHKVKEITKTRIKPAMLASIALVIGLILTILSWKIAVNSVENQAWHNFVSQTDNITSIIEKRMDIYLGSLYGLQGFFEGSNEVERGEFAKYINTTNLKKHYPGLSSFVYAEKVLAKDKTKFEREVQRDTSITPEGFPDYKIYPESKKDEYYAVKFLEPLTPERQTVLGFDVSSDTNRFATLEQARDTNEAVSTNRIILATTNHPGFWIALPIYIPGSSHSTTSERRQNLMGFVSAVFRPEELYSYIFQENQLTKDISFKIYLNHETQPPSEDNLIYTHDTSPKSEITLSHPQFSNYKTIKTAGKTWSIYFDSLPTFGLSQTAENMPLLVLVLGIDISFLLFGIIYLSARSYKRSLDIAQNMIEKLNRHELTEHPYKSHKS